ncbi:hypothetical protein TDB9533_01993 [Thalassocella blandensis]|nr:hypothetical protein TDB9533_01993 [Thalassocella blandensis]
MANDWGSIPLGDLVSLQRGHDLPSQDRLLGAIPVMGSSGVTGYHNLCKTKGPGVVIGRSGNSMGVVSYCNVDFWPLNTVLYVTDFKGNDERYIYYLLSQIDFNQFNSGSAQKSLNRNAIYPYKIWATKNKVEQALIGKLLEEYENKIQLNRQMNQTLEQMAQALFKSWFVDFDPVMDKLLASGKPIPEELQAHAERRRTQLAQLANDPDHKPLDADILALFPDEFEYVEQDVGNSVGISGWVPKGWESKAFGDLLEQTIGGDWGKEEYDEKHSIQSVIIRGTDIPQLLNGSQSSAPKRWVEPKKLNTRSLADSDIVIEVSGGSPTQPTGRSLMITENLLARLEGVVEPASFCRKLRPINEEVGLLLGLHLKKIYAEGKTWEYQNTSTGISNFQTKIFLAVEKVVFPPLATLKAFFRLTRPMVDKSTSNENIYLEKLRDTLLPKLISGELRIPEAKEKTEGAA